MALLQGVLVLQLVRVKGSSYRYHVVRSDGLPDEPLTAFIEEQRHCLAEGSVSLYTRELLAFLNWSLSDPIAVRNAWTVLGSTAEVRQLVLQYLTVAASCKVAMRPDQLGLKVGYVNETSGTHINTRAFLCALRRFYDFLIERSDYTEANPLAVTGYSAAVRELHRSRHAAMREIAGRNPMPAASGVDAPSDIRLSSNYFRCAGREWLPKSIDDPSFPSTVYKAGREYGWGLREFCIVRTLRGTPMSSNLIRDHYWRPALRAAGIHAHPHQARHWFVTNALRNIEATASGEQDQARRKEELIRYMKWRSGEKMLHAYEHVDRETRFITKTLPAIHAEMKRMERKAGNAGAVPPAMRDTRKSSSARALDPDLALLTGVQA